MRDHEIHRAPVRISLVYPGDSLSHQSDQQIHAMAQYREMVNWPVSRYQDEGKMLDQIRSEAHHDDRARYE